MNCHPKSSPILSFVYLGKNKVSQRSLPREPPTNEPGIQFQLKIKKEDGITVLPIASLANPILWLALII